MSVFEHGQKELRAQAAALEARVHERTEALEARVQALEEKLLALLPSAVVPAARKPRGGTAPVAMAADTTVPDAAAPATEGA